MTTRTFRYLGQAYGSVPATITAKIDGVEVFSGPVPAIDEPPPAGNDVNRAQPIETLFTWTKDTSFSGTVNLEVSVQDGTVLMVSTDANYPYDAPSFANEFVSYYSEEVDGVLYDDPLDNETINGISVTRNFEPELAGQWNWLLTPGATFTATVNINASSTNLPG